MTTPKIESELELIRHAFVASVATMGGDSVTDGLFAIADAIKGLTRAVNEVGVNMVTPEMGDALRGLASLAHGISVDVEGGSDVPRK